MIRRKIDIIFSVCYLRPILLSRGGREAVMELKDHKHKVSYSIGVDIGRSLQKNGTDVDVEVLAQGMKDLLTGEPLLMTDEEIKEVFTKVKAENAAKQYAKYEAVAETNKKDGAAFLERNCKEEGVILLPSGLQYQVLKEGSGLSPRPSDTVNVHYRGMFIDGREFDSSYQRGQPTSFPVMGVIKGWTEALQLMKLGAKWRIAVPPGLAYGEAGTPGGPIGPNQVLLFELEILQIVNAEQGLPKA
jgi:FKBP-type peptidyl-prolyl cis-trans isomerase FklB